MTHKEELDELHRKSLSKFDEYLENNPGASKEAQEKLQQEKNEWQVAWNKLMETMLVLERLEI